MTNEQQSRQLAQLELAAAQTQQESRRLQASQVSIWFARQEPSGEDNRSELIVRYINGSGQPVYDTLLTFPIFGGSLGSRIGIPVLPPTVESEMSARSSDIVRKNLYEFAASVTRADGYTPDAEGFKNHLRMKFDEAKRIAFHDGIEIEFRDAAGLRWRRDSRGVLTEMNTDR